MSDDPFRIPTEAEISEAEQRLGMVFPDGYREFLLGGSDVLDAALEPAVILPGSGHLDLFEIAEAAWNEMGIPGDLLPFVEDNGDYFCLTPSGEVVYWSHNGRTDERWPDIAAWRADVCAEVD